MLKPEPRHPTPEVNLPPKSRRQLGDYEIHIAREGFASIRQISSGEIMHSRTDPMEEARSLYVEQSNLGQRLRLFPSEDLANVRPLLIWDVGLGAAANALAAIHCYEEKASKNRIRPLRIVSFENNLDSLRLALQDVSNFPYLHHPGPATIVEEGAWKSGKHLGLEWSLLLGDFLETIRNALGPPDLIYYDMFSTKTSAQLWSLATFRKLFQVCCGHSVELFTYTCSTANRAAMLAAGFYLARGRNAGHKLETTIAITPAAHQADSPYRHPLLGRDWLEKWSRSRAKFPHDLPTDEQASFRDEILAHPQFKN